MVRRLCFAADETRKVFLWAPWRFICFFFLHLSLVVAARAFVGSPFTSLDYASPFGTVVALCKFLVFLPAVVLLPRKEWLRFARVYEPEWAAAVIALLTFYPYRIFAAAWPLYSQALGHSVHVLASLFVPGVGYQAGDTPTIMGPALDVEILFSCGGLDGIRLFQLLFGLLLILDWDRLRRRRAFIGYFSGMSIVLLANALRITLMVVLGNRVSAEMVVLYHLNAGWIFFASVFLLYLVMTYRWLLGIERKLPCTANEA